MSKASTNTNNNDIRLGGSATGKRGGKAMKGNTKECKGEEENFMSSGNDNDCRGQSLDSTVLSGTAGACEEGQLADRMVDQGLATSATDGIRSSEENAATVSECSLKNHTSGGSPAGSKKRRIEEMSGFCPEDGADATDGKVGSARSSKKLKRNSGECDNVVVEDMLQELPLTMTAPSDQGDKGCISKLATKYLQESENAKSVTEEITPPCQPLDVPAVLMTTNEPLCNLEEMKDAIASCEET